MTADEMLKIISKPWCSFKDLRNITQLGETKTCQLRVEIKNYLESQGYILPSRLLPMSEVVKYLKLDINYLENICRKENDNEIN